MEPKKPTITRIDKTSTPGMVYIGKAQPGAKEDRDWWKISRADTSAISVLFAGGTGEFNKKWSERIIYDYF